VKIITSKHADKEWKTNEQFLDLPALEPALTVCGGGQAKVVQRHTEIKATENSSSSVLVAATALSSTWSSAQTQAASRHREPAAVYLHFRILGCVEKEDQMHPNFGLAFSHFWINLKETLGFIIATEDTNVPVSAQIITYDMSYSTLNRKNWS
jgi:hypothetical protein